MQKLLEVVVDWREIGGRLEGDRRGDWREIS